MEIKLTFLITFTNGDSTTQEISVPADPQHPVEKQMLFLMQQMLQQYAGTGLLRNPSPGNFFLICPSQIATVECTLPSIVLAGANEIPKSSLITE
jgi:hypothetical protein